MAGEALLAAAVSLGEHLPLGGWHRADRELLLSAAAADRAGAAALRGELWGCASIIRRLLALLCSQQGAVVETADGQARSSQAEAASGSRPQPELVLTQYEIE